MAKRTSATPLLPQGDVKAWLDEAVLRYNTPAFIAADPISIPHLFTKREDIEIAGFLTATLAWGQRPTILANARRLMALMDDDPHAFVCGATARDLKRFEGFVHRTFNGADCIFFMRALHNIYTRLGGMEAVISEAISEADADVTTGLIALRDAFFSCAGAQPRTHKHFSDVTRGAAAKRLNMFLRWMVRRDCSGVDFGLWRGIHPRQLLCPLDLHTGNVARALGLLYRPQNDLKAVQELTAALRLLDAADPIRYDIALFGLGADGLLKK